MLNSRFLDFPFYDIISDTIILVFFIILLWLSKHSVTVLCFYEEKGRLSLLINKCCETLFAVFLQQILWFWENWIGI